MKTATALMKLHGLAFMLLVSTQPTPARPAVSIESGNDNLLNVVISGAITKDDLFRVQLINAQIKKRQSTDKNNPLIANYFLNSEGGQVETSIEIGRILRSQSALVFVPKDGVCASACVFILAGAASRHIEGRVAIHRPYLPNDSEASPELQREKYQKLRAVVVKYLQEMNVSPKLYDDMLYISPDRVKTLTSEELFGYGMVEEDPFIDEARAASKAKRLGISRKELARRTELSRRKCALPLSDAEAALREHFGCVEEVLKGKKQ